MAGNIRDLPAGTGWCERSIAASWCGKTNEAGGAAGFLLAFRPNLIGDMDQRIKAFIMVDQIEFKFAVMLSTSLVDLRKTIQGKSNNSM